MEDILKLEYFNDITEISDMYKNLKPTDYMEIWKSIIFPIKKDIYFLWAESYEILLEMVQTIFISLNISTNNK